jgi:hypothetical protein
VSKPKRPARTSPPATAAPPPVRWSFRLRLFVSALVAFHIFAVFVGPWAMPQQASPLAADCARLIHPYLDVLYLNNGYRFFAPEPGPSHLVRYELTLADGKRIKGTFPDRNVNRPRLLYHRYFMLSEFINTISVPPDGPPELRKQFDLCVRSYARHLVYKYDAQQVKLTLVQHLLPGINAVRTGSMRLDDPRLYEEQQLGTFRKDEL